MSLVKDYLGPADSGHWFADARWLDALLRFESALAQAQADCGLVPRPAAEAIARACAQAPLTCEGVVEQARASGALGLAVVRPLQQWLQAHAPEGLPWLHWGATTQDAVDTAQALLTQQALQALLAELDALQSALQALARTHAATPMLARSLLQPAQITSFGFKCAQSAAAVGRSIEQFERLATAALCVQLGGAVGNGAVLGSHRAEVEQALARRLGLSACGRSWHTQRDDWMRLAMEAAVCGGSLAKLAKDWSLMAQYEVGEVSEAPRGSTSSAMPHKRNPVHLMQAVAQAQAVPQFASLLLGCMAQAHERALGEWQAEVAHWPDLWRHVHGAAAALRQAAQSLQVHPQRMLGHVRGLHGLVFSEACVHAMAPWTGKPEALAAVELLAPQALEQGRELRLLLAEWAAPRLDAAALQALQDALARACDPARAVQASHDACLALLAAPQTHANAHAHSHA
ncbi:fumarate lyase [Delftia acidovorans SPH-1]|uniref:Fumarate lyase n=1 Tax=Delftia acidovorans (strain DSM 14801 / SPH-1) TaxID=398578 RepID=A9BQE6_DELAS|nr:MULTISPECIES: lyase family protein [Delftia]MBA4003578.1 fumarate lyase [Delftia sp.]OLE92995.1 MAG: fumarate lyase [Delftia sp. 13_1_40CM_3_66_6]ABX33556.1 fumarate lyase [Delftia acidovorans SPH-1]MCP4020058.1 fumarate lyase [Delftia sp.]MCP4534941.1 fumarate lyase [Delftia sp.]